jgi:hypothetical protein
MDISLSSAQISCCAMQRLSALQQTRRKKVAYDTLTLLLLRNNATEFGKEPVYPIEFNCSCKGR